MKSATSSTVRRILTLVLVVTAFFLLRSHSLWPRGYPAQNIHCARIDDLNLRAQDVLWLSPDVAEVSVNIRVTRPKHRIIHVVDAHCLSRLEYRSLQRPATEEGYLEHGRAIENLINHQCRLLCWLVDGHGLREVFQESVSEETLARFLEDNRKSHDNWHRSRPVLRRRLAELRGAIDCAEFCGEDATAIRAKARAVETSIQWRLTQGAVRNLLVARPCVELLAAEDDDAFRAGLCKINASIKGGTTWRGAENDRREAAIVANLLTRRCAVIVLGRAHDLSKQIQLQSGGDCEYIRVTPKGFPTKIEQNGRITWVSE